MKNIIIGLSSKECFDILTGAKDRITLKKNPKTTGDSTIYLYCSKPNARTISGCMVIYDDELYSLPTGEIRYGCSLELWGNWSGKYTKDNFLNGKVVGYIKCEPPTQDENVTELKVTSTTMFTSPKEINCFYKLTKNDDKKHISTVPRGWLVTDGFYT